ncbi:MAG: hypothetical protein F9K42_05365, partial [Ignavibacterium sp.]
MSPEELKLVEEFTVAVDSAHTSIFSSHLQKQLNELREYIGKHTDEVDKHSQNILDLVSKKIQAQVGEYEKNYNSLLDRYKKERDELDRKLHLQIREIEKNYDNQLAIFERQKRETFAEFSDKINDIADVTAKPIQIVQKELSEKMLDMGNEMRNNFNGVHSEINSLEGTLLRKYDKDINNILTLMKEEHKNLFDRVIKLSNELFINLEEMVKMIKEFNAANGNNIKERFDETGQNINILLNNIIEERIKDRKYLWGPLIFSMFLMLVLY